MQYLLSGCECSREQNARYCFTLVNGEGLVLVIVHWYFELLVCSCVEDDYADSELKMTVCVKIRRHCGVVARL